jgi:hypothetical protein
MTTINRNSQASGPNPDVQKIERRSQKEDNLAWIERVARRSPLNEGEANSFVLLAGGSDPLSFRMRLAQAHVRPDLSPSAWSTAVFIPALKSNIGESETIGISLMPADWYPPFGFAPTTNAIQHGKLSQFMSNEFYPNIALLSFPVKGKDVKKSLAKLETERLTIDLSALLLRWIQYAWGTGMPANPLGEGIGMPSAAMLETAFAANGFDLTPGLESRSSCPEAIWQAARWWHEYYRKSDKRIVGAFIAPHGFLNEDYYKK